jgi:signal peptidase I
MLVDKLSYHFRDPERFEVLVFRYPLDRSKVFVKRLWGLPGEQLRIDAGDVWVRRGEDPAWVIPRRPAGVQRSTWKPLDRGESDPQRGWQVVDGGWSVAERELVARGDGRARFVGHGGGGVVDGYLDGYPEPVRASVSPRAESGYNGVGDLRVEGRVRALPGCRAVAVELTEGGRRYRLELPGPAAEADAAPRIRVLSEDGRVAEGAGEALGAAWRLPAGRWVGFVAQNLDDLLELEADGAPRASLAIAPALDQSGSGAFLAQEGEGADLEALQVSRDIFYTPSRLGESEWQIPPGEYFMLGDNTQDSSDSREWLLVDVRWRDEGGAERSALANFRPAQAPDANPVTANTPDGELTWARDEWGEVHVFPAAAELRSPNRRDRIPRPTVGRELITGRVVAVFWPVSPGLGLWRPRWVR